MSAHIPAAQWIEQATHDVPGWSPQDQLLALFTLAFSTAHLGGDVLEIGAWCGRSAVALGLAAKLSGQGRLHSVDLFPEKTDWFRNADGSYSFAVDLGDRQLKAYDVQTVWEAPYLRDIAPVYARHERILDVYQATVDHAGLRPWVQPFKGDLSAFAAQAPAGLALRLAFVDGDHGYEAVSRDIDLIERFLLPGGWLCFDDAFTSYQGVDDAIQKHVIDSGRYEACQQITRKLFAARRR